MGVHPFWSVVLICYNTEEGLTRWMGVHPFLYIVLIYANTGDVLTSWMGVHPFWSVVLICYNTEEGVTFWMVFILSNQWFWSSQTLKRDSQTGWVFTRSCKWSWPVQTLESNSLPEYVFTILVSSSDLLNLRERLTSWIGVHPFSSVVLNCLTLERYSLSGWVFTHSCQWFWSAQTLETYSLPG